MSNISKHQPSRAQLIKENEELRRRLDEAEQTLQAIREGEVDALVVAGPQGEQVYSITGAEHIYRLIVETMNEAALTVDLDGTILFCNQRFCDLMKTPMENVLGRRITAFAPEPQHWRLRKLLADASDGPAQRRLVLLAGDGAEVPVQVAASPLPTDGPVSLCLGATDLTELEASAHSIRVLREHEQALAESESRYRELVQNANSAIIRWERDGTITFFNEYAQAFFGYSEEEAVGRNASFLLPEADSAGADLKYLVRDIVNHPERYASHVNENIRRDGRRVWMAWANKPIYDENAQVTGVLAIGTDITDRKEAEEALQEANEQLRVQTEELRVQTEELLEANQALSDAETRLRLATEATHFGTFDYYPQTGKLIWSSYMRQHFGILSPDMPIDYRTFLNAIHPDDRERVNQASRNAMSPESGGKYAVEYRAIGIEDHKERWLECRGQAFFDNKGRAVRFIGGARDITEAKMAQQALQAMTATLEQQVQQRTADLIAANQELEAFTYSVSHDLRAPLRHVMGFVELLGSRTDPNSDQEIRRYVKIILEASQRMGKLIDGLLTLSRVGRVAMANVDVDLGRLVDEAREVLSGEMVGRTIDWRIGPLPHVRGDATLLRTVVVNLLSNAIKYTQKKDPARIEVGSEVRNEELIFYVRDNGAGFDMHFSGKLFGVFQRLHPVEEFDGTGIGLASVRRIIERHGGRVWAEGKVDHGATFYFSLPVRSIGL
jgi:PAS domain S-box-containing protein